MTASDVIQIVLMGLLVVVTGVYAWRTHVMSKATKEQADASVKMAKEMKEQKYDAVRPVIDIQREVSSETQVVEAYTAIHEDTSHGLLCILHNIGLGTATDVRSLVQPPWAPWGQSQRHDFGTLAIGGEPTMNLSLEQEDNRTSLVVYYKDVYGRAFESSREVSANKEIHGWEIGPLKIRKIAEEE